MPYGTEFFTPIKSKFDNGKSYPGHAGIPGHVGGSRPRGGAIGGAVGSSISTPVGTVSVGDSIQYSSGNVLSGGKVIKIKEKLIHVKNNYTGGTVKVEPEQVTKIKKA